MTSSERPGDRFDPFAYDPGDRVGLCLDIDGTVYPGSVFIETLAFLPYADGVTLTPAERRHRRAALAAVAEYQGGTAAKTKWRGVLVGLDALRVAGAEALSETLLEALSHRSEDRASRRDVRPASRIPSGSSDVQYRTMRESVLSAYGALLRGRNRDDVADAVTEVVTRRCEIDPELRATLDRLARHDDTELYLVTDAPEHVAAGYARKLSGAARVVGTTYDVDGTGRFTGTFDRVDKGNTVARLRDEREWEYVVAAGDSAVDAVMADDSNLFLAVAGHGDIDDRFDEWGSIPSPRSERDVRERLGPNRNSVRVRLEEDLAAAVRTTLRAVGVRLSSPE